MTPRIQTSASDDPGGSPEAIPASPSQAWLVRAADVSWRLLIVFALVGVVGWLLFQLSVVVIPLVLAMLFSAVLIPTTDLLAERIRLPRGLAAALLLAAFLAVLALASALLWTAFAVVQQVEGNLLQPYVMGRAVALHPMVVLVTITVGVIVLGVAGAFVAVPLVAGVWRACSVWHRASFEPGPEAEGYGDRATDVGPC